VNGMNLEVEKSGNTIMSNRTNAETNETGEQIQSDKSKSLFSHIRNKAKLFWKKEKDNNSSLPRDQTMIVNQSESVVGLNNTSTTEPSLLHQEMDSNKSGSDVDHSKLYMDDTPQPENSNHTERKRYKPIFLLDHVIT
jgi:hypothetical protein